jgi:hypothetical protein
VIVVGAGVKWQKVKAKLSLYTQYRYMGQWTDTLKRTIGGPMSQYEHTEGQKNVSYLLGTESRFTGCPSRSLAAVAATLSRFPEKSLRIIKTSVIMRQGLSSGGESSSGSHEYHPTLRKNESRLQF